jgi:hypothetical protein
MAKTTASKSGKAAQAAEPVQQKTKATNEANANITVNFNKYSKMSEPTLKGIHERKLPGVKVPKGSDGIIMGILSTLHSKVAIKAWQDAQTKPAVKVAPAQTAKDPVAAVNAEATKAGVKGAPKTAKKAVAMVKKGKIPEPEPEAKQTPKKAAQKASGKAEPVDKDTFDKKFVKTDAKSGSIFPVSDKEGLANMKAQGAKKKAEAAPKNICPCNGCDANEGECPGRCNGTCPLPPCKNQDYCPTRYKELGIQLPDDAKPKEETKAPAKKTPAKKPAAKVVAPAKTVKKPAPKKAPAKVEKKTVKKGKKA